MKQEPKRYIIRKYIYAQSAMDAIKKDKTSPVDDVWVDVDYKPSTGNVGFKS